MEILKIAEKIMMDAVMYADMDESDFWATSTISPEEAQQRAIHYEAFFRELNNALLGLNDGGREK